MELIGSAIFRRLAEKKNLDFVADGPGRGLIADFSRLRGPGDVAFCVFTTGCESVLRYNKPQET